MAFKILLVACAVCLILWLIIRASKEGDYHQRKLEITQQKLKRKQQKEKSEDE